MCGIFGFAQRKKNSTPAEMVLSALCTLNHRGHGASGIVSVSPEGSIYEQRKLGVASRLGERVNLEKAHGHVAFGHNRYGTFGGEGIEDAQPLVRIIDDKPIVLVHNGEIVWLNIDGARYSVEEARKKFQTDGVVFNGTADTELILTMIARSQAKDPAGRIYDALSSVEGSFSLAIYWHDLVFIARDSRGMRPLWLGGNHDYLAFSSEDCAFGHLDIDPIREVKPGEIVIIDRSLGVRSVFLEEKNPAHCSFCHVYVARPDSTIYGRGVMEVRQEFGRVLAEEMDKSGVLNLDWTVIPVLASGQEAATGFAEYVMAQNLRLTGQANWPLVHGLTRNQYSGRNFITAGQGQREKDIDLKHNVVRHCVKGKHVVLIDDSLVRGTTAKLFTKRLRKAGALSVHIAIACPPVVGPCWYGIDFKETTEQRLAIRNGKSITEYVGADSVTFLSIDGLRSCVGSGYCTGCFTGEYPTDLPT